MFRPVAAMVILLVAFTLIYSGSVVAQDYLSPNLRADVERLKADSATTPSNQENARDRARLLWRWLNAYAGAGKHIPPNATTYVNAVMNAPAEARLTPGRLTSLDNYIREFSVYDDEPSAMGHLEMLTPGPFPIESWQTLDLRYTVGDMPMEPGAVVVLNRHFQSDAGRWQASDPAGDNYVSIRASDSGTQFTATTMPL